MHIFFETVGEGADQYYVPSVAGYACLVVILILILLIISLISGKKKFKVATVCTWPIETGRKVKMAGQTLFYQMFKAFNKSKAVASKDFAEIKSIIYYYFMKKLFQSDPLISKIFFNKYF